MKKLFYMLMLSLLTLSSCKKDKLEVPALPKLTFVDAAYEVPKGASQQIRILLDKPVTSETEIALTFSGDAVKGTDYTVSADKFVVPANEKEAVILVTMSKDITEIKNIKLAMANAPAGYEFGRFFETNLKITLATTTIFSFATQTVDMIADEIAVGVMLLNQLGEIHKVTEATDIIIKVNESSTAVLGTHFRFKDNKDYASIAKKKNVGNVIIEFLKYEEGKTEIVLECGESAGYHGGTTPTVIVNLNQGMAARVVGEWVGYGFHRLDDFASGWWSDDSYKEKLPMALPTDVLNFKADGNLEVNLTGKLKNYLRNSTYKLEGSEITHIFTGSAARVMTPICNLSAVNYKFSATAEELLAKKIHLTFVSDDKHDEILIVRIEQYDATTADFGDLFYGYNELLPMQFVRKK